jgi:hypothetical protein
VQIICRFLRSELPGVAEGLANVNVIEEVTSLVFNNPWNSVLHSYFYDIALAVLDSDCTDLKRALVVNSQLPQRLIDVIARPMIPSRSGNSEKLVRNGFLGHATRISNLVAKHASLYIDVKSMVAKCAGWDAFVAGHLSDINEIESKKLGVPDTSESIHTETPDELRLDDIFAMGGTMSKEELEDFEKMLSGNAPADNTTESQLLNFGSVPELLDEILHDTSPIPDTTAAQLAILIPSPPIIVDDVFATYNDATFWRTDLPNIDLEDIDDL